MDANKGLRRLRHILGIQLGLNPGAPAAPQWRGRFAVQNGVTVGPGDGVFLGVESTRDPTNPFYLYIPR
jgi:hypothetical protein